MSCFKDAIRAGAWKRLLKRFEGDKFVRKRGNCLLSKSSTSGLASQLLHRILPQLIRCPPVRRLFFRIPMWWPFRSLPVSFAILWVLLLRGVSSTSLGIGIRESGFISLTAWTKRLQESW